MRPAILILFISANTIFAQQFDFVIEGYRSYLPSTSCSREYYQWNSQDRVFHKYEKLINYFKCNRFTQKCRETKKRIGRITHKTRAEEALEYVKCHRNDSIFYIPTSAFYRDSIDCSMLESQGWLKNDTLTINTEYYERLYHRPYEIDGLLILRRFSGMQIDGEWLGIQIIEEQDTLIDYHLGASMSAYVETFNEWIILYNLYNEFGLFQNLNLSCYFSKQNMTYEIGRFIEELKR